MIEDKDKNIQEFNIGGKKYWMNVDEYEAQNKWLKERELAYWKYRFYGIENIPLQVKRAKLKLDLKWCLVIEGKTLKFAMIDKKTDIIYKVDKYTPTLIKSKGIFVRYLTTMDL